MDTFSPYYIGDRPLDVCPASTLIWCALLAAFNIAVAFGVRREHPFKARLFLLYALFVILAPASLLYFWHLDPPPAVMPPDDFTEWGLLSVLVFGIVSASAFLGAINWLVIFILYVWMTVYIWRGERQKYATTQIAALPAEAREKYRAALLRVALCAFGAAAICLTTIPAFMTIRGFSIWSDGQREGWDKDMFMVVSITTGLALLGGLLLLRSRSKIPPAGHDSPNDGRHERTQTEEKI